jgi:hypothetical protein
VVGSVADGATSRQNLLRFFQALNVGDVRQERLKALALGMVGRGARRE